MAIYHHPCAGRPFLIDLVAHTVQHPKPPQYLKAIQIQMQGLPSIMLMFLTIVIHIGCGEVRTSGPYREKHRAVLRRKERKREKD